MKPFSEKKLSTESIPSDQLNYSLQTHNNSANLTQNTSPISTDTTKEQTAPNIQNTQSASYWTDLSILSNQIISEIFAAAITQSVMPTIGINLQGVLMGYINLTLFKGYPAYDNNTNYEEEYDRAFIMNEIMVKKLTQYCEEINHISERAKRLQDIFEQKLMKVNQNYSENLSRPQEPLSQQFVQTPYIKQYSQDLLNHTNNVNIQRILKNQEENLAQTNKVSESLSNNVEKNDMQKRGIKEDTNELDAQITFSDFEGNNEYNTQSQSLKRRKNRRCATQIQKKFECPYSECKKTYGSEVSLNLHIKLKHNGGNKTERERLARQMFVAKINGKQLPQASLNLPPGFLEQYKDGLKKIKCSREIPYSSNNLKANSEGKIMLPTTAKSENQIKID